MAGTKKFGAFSGVFTPSILTILGVILYMRMGWVVGNAGLVGAVIIVIVAHIISVTTGLSVSSIATDKKVGAGGIYYILSRSMGIPIGGAIGLALYVGTAFSIALYLIGFAESFNGYFGLDTGINGLRISGSAAMLILTAIALISTSVALKTQFFILAAIVVSLVSIFLGSGVPAPETVSMIPVSDSVPLEIIFAIFFPAVTGFTAGTAMSGNLRDPNKSIPVGTIAAIAVGFAVYIAIAIFLAYSVSSESLRSDYNILMKLAYFAPAVVAGIWGATLSSALGGILGGPRILQAMSLDKVTPRVFGKGRGRENEPINALIFVFVIAQAGILIGELDVIARVVSMFYLAAYGFINISFFLESWANPDFQPSFKVTRWVGLIGFVACFGVMFKLDMIAMFASIIVIVGIHFWLQRKHIELEGGNVWRSVWEKVVAKGLNKIETDESKDGKWNPNIILFSGESAHRPYLLEFSKTVSGRTGIVTNFSLVKRGGAQAPIKKTEQAIKDETFEELGIFGRKIEVDDIYKGIENVATTFGFSGIDPNTVMMGWTKTPETLIEFAKMTQNLVRLDYNILFLDFNKKTKFGNKESIDLWLRNTDGNNAEMMMNIGRFILQSPSWSKAKIRILFVNNTETEGSLVKAEITKITEKLRIGPEIKVISNSAEKLGIHKIIELESSETDLVIMGIPEGRVKEHVEFVKETDELFKSIGTTLLVKASNSFNVLDFDFSYDRLPQSREELNLKPLPVSEVEEVSDLVAEFDRHLSKTTNDLTSGAIAAISSIYMQFLESAELEITTILDECSATDSIQTISTRSIRAIRKIIRLSEDFAENKLISANGMLERDIYQFVSVRNRFLENVSKTVKIELPDIYPGARGSKTSKIYWRTILNYFARKKVLTNTRNSLFYFGVRSFSLINKLSKFVSEEHYLLLKNLANEKPDALPEFRRRISKVFDVLRDECIRLEQQTAVSLRTYERDTCADLVREIEDPEFNRRIRRLSRRLNRKDIAKNQLAVSEFSENWLRNQVSAHEQSAAALNLLTAGIRVFTTNERIKLYFENTVVGSQNSKIELLSAASDELKKDGKAKKPADLNTRKIEKLAEGIDYINFDNILDREEAGILRISGSMPVSVELMSADSFKSLLKDGARENERIALNLADVQGIIVQSHYLTPLQETKERLAGVSNEIAEEIYYIANLISHVIAKSGSETEGPAHKNIPKDVDERIQVCKTKLATTLDSFAHEIDTNLESTLSELSIFQILDSAETYRNTVRAPVVKSKLNDWYEQKRSELSGVYNNAVDFAIQRKQEIDTRKFEVADDKYLNKIEITSNFVRSLKVKPEVEKELPFYLEKLSVAGSAGKTHLSGKEENFRSAKQAIDRIKDGVSGAIMVVGESLSGRTYFTEAVARSLLRGERVHINPPSKQNFDVNDMHFAFQLAFERSGTTKAILEQANKNTVLIFNDLERWWIKSSNGDTVINYLAKMVEDYGNRHFFLFNSNIHSFQIIKETTDLERSLLSTIVLSPARKSELKEAILDRYHIAGVKLFYNGRPLSNARRVDALFAELFAKSNGKIGLALNTWGSNIEKDEEKNLSICVPQSLKFPDIKDPYWVILLYQLILHNRLTQTHIDELFGHEDRERVLMSLREMEKAELIYKQINDGYVLNSPAGHYVEIWLKGLGILG